MLEQVLQDISDCRRHNLNLPSYCYTDAAVHTLEQDLVFRRTWQYIGHVGQVESPGDHFTTTMAGLPIVVTRDAEMGLHAFINACRHRCHAIADGPGNRSTLQCPYHGWTYNLNGTLRAAPRSDREEHFDKDRLSLLPIQIDTWGPLLFANIDLDAVSLADYLGDLPARVAADGYNMDGYRLHLSRANPLACNWKVHVENSIECYHCPVAHKSYSKIYDVRPEVYGLEVHKNYNIQHSVLRDGVKEAGAGDFEEDDFHVYFLWPNTFVAPGRHAFTIAYVRQVDENNCLLTSDDFFDDTVSAEQADDHCAFYGLIAEEDVPIQESVQRAHKTKIVPPGPLLVDSELLVQHTQEMLHSTLSGDAIPTSGAWELATG